MQMSVAYSVIFVCIAVFSCIAFLTQSEQLEKSNIYAITVYFVFS